MTQTHTAVDPDQGFLIVPGARLDCCSAPEAKTRFARGGQSLYMCGHHTAQHQDRLTLEGWKTFRLIS